MPPKKAATTTKKASGSAPAHATYQDMIKEAIINLKDRQGSSRQALKKYVLANNNLNATDAAFTSQFNRALTKGSENGVFERPKGPSGPVKIAKSKATSPPASKKADAKKTGEPKATKAAPKTAAKAKKPAAAKDAPAAKASTKKAAATKKAPAKAAAGKKTATTKANVSKVRKSAPAAPAVEETKPVVLGKTKSGRVTKSTAPSAPATKAAATKKKAAPKKATPKKK